MQYQCLKLGQLFSPSPSSTSPSNALQTHKGTTTNAAPQTSQNSNSDPDILVNSQQPPVAACTVSLSLVPVIILVARIMSLKHKQKLKAD